MTIAEAIADAAARLAAKGVPDARFDAEVLLRHVLGRDRAWLVAHYPDAVDNGTVRSFEELIARRGTREPLQYITGTQEFWGLPFRVDRNVLIPRPETELVVEETLRRLAGKADPVIIDLCTGSGCIAISLACELPEARVFATDRSAAALAVARENAIANGVGARIRFLEGDLFGPVGELDLAGRVDIITANPPYVPAGDRAGLQAEVRDFEPEIALFSGPAGTEVAERIINDARRYLRTGGSLVMEMGIGQGAALREMLGKNSDYREAEVLRDLAGIERVIAAERR